jgi:hypothetical protein
MRSGPLEFVCEWPTFGRGETRIGIDAKLILDAAGRSTRLWPERRSPATAWCSFLGGGTADERGALGVRSDVLLGIALQAPLVAECFTGRAGDTESGIGVRELVGTSPVSDYAIDGDFGLGRATRSS